MRLAFFLLLLANLGVLVWYGWVATSDEAGDVYREPIQEDRLALVDEPTDPSGDEPANAGADSEQEAATPEEAAAPEAAGAEPSDDTGGSATDPEAVAETPVEPAGTAGENGETAGAAGAVDRLCVSYGPFPTEERAAAAGARLRRGGLNPERRQVEGRLRVGYWVYLPPQSSEEEAESVTETLRENGFTDFYIVRSGEKENAVSLGVFSDTARADRRAARIGQMGLKPRITDRYREATVFWLDVTGAPRQLPPAEDLRQYAGSAGEVRRDERDCPTD